MGGLTRRQGLQPKTGIASAAMPPQLILGIDSELLTALDFKLGIPARKISVNV